MVHLDLALTMRPGLLAWYKVSKQSLTSSVISTFEMLADRSYYSDSSNSLVIFS